MKTKFEDKVFSILVETDFGSNVVCLHNKNNAYTRWLMDYFLDYGKKHNYRIDVITFGLLKVDNGRYIKIAPQNSYRFEVSGSNKELLILLD